MVGGFERRDFGMLASFVRMALRDRYLGSTLGMLWAILNPLIMLGLFTFIFGFVMKARLPGAETTLAYSIWLISGYGPWLAFTEGLSASTNSVVGNSGLIKNMAFKRELLPIAYAITGLIPLLVSIAFLLVLMAVDGRWPGWSILLIAPAILLQFGFIAAIGLVLASFNAFVRDVAQVLPNILTVVMFSSPIFYTLDSFPVALQRISMFNPFYGLTEAYRRPLLTGNVPDLVLLIPLAVAVVAMLVFGLRIFRRLAPHFESRL